MRRTQVLWVLDAALAAFVAGVATVLAWSDSVFLGQPLEGPLVLRRVFPLFLGLPLLLRRVRPLLAWCLVMGALAVQSLASRDPEGLEVVVALAVGSYSVAAYSTRPRAVVGLLVLLAGDAIWTSAIPELEQDDEQWAAAFFAAAFVGCWLVGFVVRSRREQATLARVAEDAERRAASALQDERGRIARELHDIVSHRLSVVVVQAGGARANESASARALERIEGQAREALVEMRRMLGLLREDPADPSTAPQPGLADLPALVSAVRDSGLPVQLHVDGDTERVPRTVGLSAYRIVQESLTNVLRHAGARQAEVRVSICPERVEVLVRDDGCGMPAGAAIGHGLAGMRERAALLGGELDVRTSPDGVSLRAVLPLEAGS